MRSDRIMVTDEAIGELIARSGGYEEIERAGRWARVANSLGLRKDQGAAVKARYEDMLRASAEADEREDEDEDEEYEVEDILDSRTDENGVTQYLVKWKDVAGDGIDDDEDDDQNMTWEPREHLACPELLEQFEAKQRRRSLGGAAANGDAEVDGGEEAKGAAAAAGGGDGGAAAADSAADGEEATAGSKRKHNQIEGADDGEAESTPTGGSGAPATSAGGTLQRIVKLRRPDAALGGALVWEVLTASGAHVLLPNAKLRTEAPLLLVDWYEQRVRFE